MQSGNCTFKVVIPARYESSRFPGKPLVKIAGKSMIERTWEQCLKVVSKEDILIATDDERIMDHCNRIGAIAVLTPEDCLTGTDRVASLLDRLDEDYLVNVQGDEPIMNPDDLQLLIEETKTGKYEVLNGYTPILDEELYRSRSVPKVLFDEEGFLLYMTRAAAPASKNGSFKKAWRQVCIYSFSREALKKFRCEDRKTKLESIEDVEILRFLEMGIKVKMIPMSGKSVPVDFSEDVEKVEKLINS